MKQTQLIKFIEHPPEQAGVWISHNIGIICYDGHFTMWNKNSIMNQPIVQNLSYDEFTAYLNHTLLTPYTLGYVMWGGY